METRRSSRRLQNKTIEPSIQARKRKSESPEKLSPTFVSPKKSKIDPKRSSTGSSKLSNPNTSNNDLPAGSIIDKIRHDSIEKCVAGAADVNLSSDSESDDSSDDTKPSQSHIIDCDESPSIITSEYPSEVEQQTSDYFDFSKILSKQESFNNLLTSSNNIRDSTIKTTNSEEPSTSVENNTQRKSRSSNKGITAKPTKNETPKTRSSTSSSSVPKSSKNNSKRSKNNNKTISTKSEDFPSTNNEDLNVKELLALGEGVDTSQLVNCEEEEEENAKSADYKIPDKVEITFDLPNAGKKKKKSGFDPETALKRRLNLIKKENQVLIHKVHLLCLLSHGFHLNQSLNSELLIGVALSLIPSKQCYPPKHADISYLEDFISWFCKKIVIENESNSKFSIDCSNISSHLIACFNEHKADTKVDIVLMFIAVMRSLGLKCRLVINLQPEPLKPSSDSLFPITSKASSDNTKKTKTDPQPKKEIRKNPRFANKKTNEEKKSNRQVSKYFQSDSTNVKSTYFKEKEKEKEKNRSKSTKGKPDLPSQPSCSKSKQQDSEFIMSDEDSDDDIDDDDDDSFLPPKKSKKTPNKSPKKSPESKTSNKINRKVLSTDSEGDYAPEKPEKRKGLDVWCEVFLEAEEKWISVDIVNKRYHCVEKLYALATHPVSYVLAWNNNNTVKDLTKRYAPQWLTLTQKLRVDASWWRKTLKPYAPPKTAWEREEDEEMERQLKDQPLPVSASEFKNHPLYVLPKDLLKFQAIHPPDIAPVGYFRGEKVYPRCSVKELHTRETWLKEARVVRLGETPYKIVKARVKKDKFGFLPTEEKKSELFGIWQTEDYIPPVAQNGIVPRNSFGNVDLYLECMLPKGTVHLQLPQLQRIARKLNIDCAPAMVGFEPCRFGSRPVMDGWVVCEEFRDVLLDAWNQEFDEKTKTENEKRRKRAKANWRKLVRCLRIKKRLELRYGFNLDAGEGTSSGDQG